MSSVLVRLSEELAAAAELCDTPVEAFLVFAGERQVPLHYGVAELEEDRLVVARFNR